MRALLLAAALAATPALALQAPMPPARGNAPAALPAGASLFSATPDPRPKARPSIPEIGALAAAMPGSASQAGSICGDPRISGARLPAISEGRSCGIAQPVRVSRVAGVRLEPAATITCDTARALADWVGTTAAPAAARSLGSPLTGLKVAASYVCRSRNNQRGAKLSEHAKGRAIDISGFLLADGRLVTVEDDWRGAGRSFLRASWSGACGPFGTVLGPGSDGYHENHFHFDVARYRNGTYCR